MRITPDFFGPCAATRTLAGAAAGDVPTRAICPTATNVQARLPATIIFAKQAFYRGVPFLDEIDAHPSATGPPDRRAPLTE